MITVGSDAAVSEFKHNFHATDGNVSVRNLAVLVAVLVVVRVTARVPFSQIQNMNRACLQRF